MFRIHEFRYASNSALFIDAGQNALALGQDYSITAARKFIRMLDLSGGNYRTGSFEL